MAGTLPYRNAIKKGLGQQRPGQRQICRSGKKSIQRFGPLLKRQIGGPAGPEKHNGRLRKALPQIDRKSTRLNSSHVRISYAVFCLKKKRCTKTWTASTTRSTSRRRTSATR